MNELMSVDPTKGLEGARLIDGASFKTALRNVSGSVSIVTSGRAPERHGLTVTAASSLSVDPSTVLVCVNKSAGAHDTIVRTGCFGWNLLTASHVDLAQKFAGLDGSKGDIRFSEGSWTELVSGSPILIGSLCSFDCQVIGMHPVGTHTVFFGAVLGEVHQDHYEGLIYRHGRFAIPQVLPEAGR
ncbi:flavin reductase family protein [Bradyrhizobium sp. B120]|uniref:flavin reductase family protein n=1 Tax=Bradyrhizobium sp. B120 TaxID=3410088 RepID=UPI003B98778E